jgi:hypothetical protein
MLSLLLSLTTFARFRQNIWRSATIGREYLSINMNDYLFSTFVFINNRDNYDSEDFELQGSLTKAENKPHKNRSRGYRPIL